MNTRKTRPILPKSFGFIVIRWATLTIAATLLIFSGFVANAIYLGQAFDPEYHATRRFIIRSDRVDSFAPVTNEKDRRHDDEYFKSQITLMRSSDIVNRALKKLGQSERDKLIDDHRQRHPISRALTLEEIISEQYVILPEPKSFTVQLRYAHTDKDLAKKATDALATSIHYAAMEQAGREDDTNAKQRIEEFKEKLSILQQEIRDLKEKKNHALPTSDPQTLEATIQAKETFHAKLHYAYSAAISGCNPWARYPVETYRTIASVTDNPAGKCPSPLLIRTTLTFSFLGIGIIAIASLTLLIDRFATKNLRTPNP